MTTPESVQLGLARSGQVLANDGPDAANPASVLFNLGVDDAKFVTHYDIDHVRIYAR
jgi:phosphoribosyl 1,2-cyclic phosphodiesterase